MRYLLLISSFGLGVLISGQVLVKPTTYHIIEHETPPTDSDTDLFEFSPHVEMPDSAAQVPSGSRESGQASRVCVNGLFALLANASWHQSIFALGRPTSLFHSQLISTSDPGGETGATSTTHANQVHLANTPTAAPQRRIVAIHGGTLKLDIAQWPVFGSPDAKYVFVEMFDYCCDHCRRTHAAIAGAKDRFGDDLAVIMLPVPLNTKCNSAIRATGIRMAEACELAQLAIAVWRIDAARFGEFHDYLMTTPSIATYAEAKVKAADLVGGERLDRELATTVASQYIARHVELYRRVGAGNVPKLLFPDTTVVGEYTSVDGLVRIIQQQSERRG